jgi:DNA polymerase III, epsilon subunit and related 3''-5'' exonucleases
MSAQKQLTPQQEIQKWARDMHYAGAVVIDTEATGGAFQDEVFELSVVRVCDSKVLFDQLFRPQRPVAWHSSRVHGFTTKDLKTFPTFADYWHIIHPLLFGVPVLAFNSPFDKRLLKQTCDRYNLEYVEPSFECIMKAYGRYVGRRNGLSLSAVCEELQIPGGNHRAKEDALAATGIVQKLAN